MNIHADKINRVYSIRFIRNTNDLTYKSTALVHFNIYWLYSRKEWIPRKTRCTLVIGAAHNPSALSFQK